jgi:outer membrane lipoprotein-sorting protein
MAAELEPPPEGLSARTVAERLENTFRGETSYFEATMIVHSPRLPEPRRVGFQSWDDRPNKRSFIRITEPPKDKGMAFLKLHPNLWNYIPRVERTIRIPPSMMLQSWMGSDFSNDDLVRESSQIDDYDHRWLGVDPDPEHPESDRAFVLEYVPKEDAPVVWGRIVSWIDAERYAPLRQEYYDEDGEKLRVLAYSDFAKEGRPYPHRWSMIPLDKEGHETAVEIRVIRFDEEYPDSLFTKRNLTRREAR